MTKNCSVEKLMIRTNDESLLKIGEVRIPVINGTLGSIGANWGTTPRILKGLNGVLVNGEQSISLNTTWVNDIVITGVPEGSVGYISYSDKYKLKGLNGSSVIQADGDLYDMFGLMNECEQWRPRGSSRYSLESLAKTFPILTVIFFGYNMSGSISDLYPLKDTITSFEMTSAFHPGDGFITGTFDDFGHFYKVNTLDVVYKFNFSGTVEGYVANRLSEQPSTAGSVSVKWLGNDGRVTYQGQAITNKENNTIAWDAQGNITLT